MNDLIPAFLRPNALEATLFPPASRYHGIPTAKLEIGENHTIIYLRRRFLPPANRFAVIGEHVVNQGDRLDNVTALHLGDPELFWRLADANNAMRPEALTDPTHAIGRRLRITLPEGVPGLVNG